MVNILFVGETWQGSTARSMREGLAAIPEVNLQAVAEDHYVPAGRSWLDRAANRVVRPWHRLELKRAIMTTLSARKFDVLMIYKGVGVSAATVRQVKQQGVFTVNVFPDCSPHAHGARLMAAMGEFDLVVSTKPFHPAGWQSIYGYANRCVCVPHGYDPAVHLWPDPPVAHDFDVVLAATWRTQYHTLMQRLAAALARQSLRVGIIGSGWTAHRDTLPPDWTLAPPLTGRAYGEFLRRGRIVVAPVHRDLVLGDVRQPGDEDTIRTYELAAMNCFFLHSRTPYAQSVYDEKSEVPMWDDPEELAALVLRYLPREEERRAMAARAHARAVPAYSFPNRAKHVLEYVKEGIRGTEDAAP